MEEVSSGQCRSWCFTMNNPTQLLVLDKEVKYIVYQLEKAPTTGTPHYQGFVLFHKRKSSLKNVKEILARCGAPGCNVRRCRGSNADNEAYCTKEDTRVDGPWRLGEPDTPGKRTDLDALKADLDSRKPLSEIADCHFGSFIRYSNGISKYRVLRAEVRDWETKV